ncbi:MAG: hypothetical protein JWM56_1121 [Candidatus Peribacteria bacterium]|nr:hypothetical protein [Candidatus Peribacteria bacterium]
MSRQEVAWLILIIGIVASIACWWLYQEKVRRLKNTIFLVGKSARLGKKEDMEAYEKKLKHSLRVSWVYYLAGLILTILTILVVILLLTKK